MQPFPITCAPDLSVVFRQTRFGCSHAGWRVWPRKKKKKQWWMIVVVQGWDEGQGSLLPPLLPVVSADQGLMMDVYWTACCYWQMIAQRKVTLSRCLATILNPKKKIPVGGFCYNINALLADKMAHLRATSWPLLWNSEAFICLSMGHESHALHNYSIRHCLQFCQEK